MTDRPKWSCLQKYAVNKPIYVLNTYGINLIAGDRILQISYIQMELPCLLFCKIELQTYTIKRTNIASSETNEHHSRLEL
jgi:hypothetical protein